jgi:uncharacterized protein
MKYSLLLFLAVAFTSCNQKTESKNAAVTLGAKDSLYSDILKEERQIWVYVPNSDGHSPFFPQRYPVLYLLDGPSHFSSVVSMFQHLSSNYIIPQMIVVAIPNTDRSRDLTPTNSLLLPDGSSQEFLKTTGGAGKFTAFIEKELMPYIEKAYPAAPNKTLIGHSFGGLFAVNTLMYHPQLFNSFVAIDPSMWWDKGRLLHHADTALSNKKFTSKTLFVSVANTMDKGMDTAKVVHDTTGNSSHIRSILHLAKEVDAHPNNGLRFDWKYYGKDDHGSVPFISEYDAIRFIFDYYKPDYDFDKITADDITSHFKKVSDKIGYAMNPPEEMVNEFAYGLLQQKKTVQAHGFFNLNIVNYPKSFNAFDGMGDYFIADKDTARAVEMYTKSLSLKETAATRKKLEDIKARKH